MYLLRCEIYRTSFASPERNQSVLNSWCSPLRSRWLCPVEDTCHTMSVILQISIETVTIVDSPNSWLVNFVIILCLAYAQIRIETHNISNLITTRKCSQSATEVIFTPHQGEMYLNDETGVTFFQEAAADHYTLATPNRRYKLFPRRIWQMKAAEKGNGLDVERKVTTQNLLGTYIKPEVGH